MAVAPAKAVTTARLAPFAAAIFAGATVLGLQDYFHYILSVQTDPMLVSTTAVIARSPSCSRSLRHFR